MRFEDAVDETVEQLGSPAARETMRRDPYWPKWDAPWWRMTLLWELGLAGRIPAPAAELLCETVDAHYLHFFPATESELPSGKDPIRQVACHCALGTATQVLSACGIDVPSRLPWVRPWLLRYQLPDGGLNCDEAAYARPDGRSSVVSTVSSLEAMVRGCLGPLGADGGAFVERGLAYLSERRLFRSRSTGKIIAEYWLEPFFPRFYDYDVLRGLRLFSAAGAKPPEEAVRRMAARAADGRMPAGPHGWASARTLAWEDGRWERARPARRFGLLDAAASAEIASERLTEEWRALSAAAARPSSGR